MKLIATRYIYSRYTLILPILIVLFSMLLPSNIHALSQIETKYYTIIYDTSGEYTAGEIAKFCDDIYEKLMARYDAFTDDPKVLCIVNDAVDLANGYAQYFQNTITIYATNIDFELRGQSNWIKNVFVHEMTHMISLKKAAKGPLNYILLGTGRYNRNPDLQAMVALYHLSQPTWFSEGSAQVGAESYGAEHWDTHRDMILRTAWYENSLLTLDEMSVLSGHTSFDAEMVYNQGYSLVGYIKEKYGFDKLVELNNTTVFLEYDPLIRKVLGISAAQLYDDWCKWVDTRYARYKEAEFDEGSLIINNGSTDFYPALSPDGKYLAWLSNRGKDYAIMDLMLKDIITGKIKLLVKDVDYRVSWSNDSKRLIYAKRPPKRQNFYDIYTYDIINKAERRVSKQLRAKDPSFSPGDSLIVFVRNEGGNNDLGLLNADGSGLRYISATHDGTQFYKPSFSPNGKKILFGIYRQDSDRDIAMINSTTKSYRYEWDFADSTSGFADSTSFAADSDFTLLLGSSSDERDPSFLPDGSGILYVTDRNGVFNVNKLNFDTSRSTRLTTLYGGAFCPTVGANGDVYYAGYKSRDFSIYRTSLEKSMEVTSTLLEDRNYLIQQKQFILSDHFNVKPFSRKRILNAVVPVVNFGPSFIGSSFGLKVLDVGAEAYISDLLGQDALILGGSIGKNVKEDVSFNSSFDIQYQKKMVPLTSSTYTHSPTLFMGVSHRVINNHINRFEGEADSVYFADMPDIGFQNVFNDLHQEVSIADTYRHEFRYYNIGIQIPLASSHYLTFNANFRQYYETLNRFQEVRDYSNFLVDGVNITDSVPGARSHYTRETRFFTDSEYFRSGEFSLSYLYSKMQPTADNDISPLGTSVMLRYQHLRTTVTDSLVGQAEHMIPVGLKSDGSFGLATYNPDPLLDQLRPFKKSRDIYEFLLIGQRNQGLPYLRHAFDSLLYVAYKDVALKDAQKGEGSGYNWPLKYYLGGANLMSGYPYFSFWGTKMFYSRFDYVFPIRKRIFKNVLGIHFQRLYGSVFFEAGQTWNIKNLSMDRLREDSLKRDVGFELRLKTIWFYRLPAIVSAKVAWPLDDMGDSSSQNQRDARRFYFLLRM